MKLNRGQRFILRIYAIILILMSMFLIPWVTATNPYSRYSRPEIEYSSLFSPPSRYAVISLTQLLIQVVLLTIIMGIFFVACSGSKKEEDSTKKHTKDHSN